MLTVFIAIIATLAFVMWTITAPLVTMWIVTALAKREEKHR